jgi:predicted RNA binding protein YcfA (HicA-like mRNA interferase family)
MPKIPRITAKELLKALGKLGFSVLRVKGSHHYICHEDGRSTVIPVHSGEDIGVGLLSKILRDCEVSKEQLIECL